MTGRVRSLTVWRPRRIAVSSAMLLVASPRYSLISRCPVPSPTTTTPSPAGPGLPLHAPSVHTWIALAGTAGARCEDLGEDRGDDGAFDALPGAGRASAGSPASIATGSLPGAAVRFRAPAR